MSESNKKSKRKIEHWELVSLLLMVYDFIAFWYLTLPHCGSGLTVDLIASRKITYRPISALHGFMRRSV